MQEIDNEVDTIKRCDEWRREYMTLRREYMTLALEMNRKFAEGKAEGLAEGTIRTLHNAIVDGIITLAAIESSGRYTKEEIEAVAATLR